VKTIGIVGSRRRNTEEDFWQVRGEFQRIFQKGDNIISGGCLKGGDKFAERLAKIYNIPIIIHYPNKENLDPILIKKNSRAAYAVINYARNTLIAQDSDVLIACVTPDRKGGTEDTIKKFVKIHGKENLYLI